MLHTLLALGIIGLTSRQRLSMHQKGYALMPFVQVQYIRIGLEVTDKFNKAHPIGRTGAPQKVMFKPDGSDEDVLLREGAAGQFPGKRSAGGLPSGSRRNFRLKKLCNYLNY